VPAPAARARPPLSRRRIVEAALRLIDERGLAACTMRALGAELGVEAMSLYRHVRGKEDLWDGVVDLLQEGLAGEAPDPGDWRGVMRGFALRFRAVARAHPHAFPLLARRPASGYLAARGLAERGLRTLVEAGFTPEEAAAALRAVSRWVIGFALAESAASAAPAPEGALAGAGHPLLAGLLGSLAAEPPDELFLFGLDLLLDGLAARLG
jgi:AcrR family transcriptional regulator